MKRFLTLLAGCCLGGCPFSKEVYLPDGSVGHSISCDGPAVSVRACYEKASDICGTRGYTVVSQDRESNGFSYGQGAVTHAGGVVTRQSGAFVSRTLLVECREK